jgi:hypothetical protein
MSKTIKPNKLADAIAQELALYHKDVIERVDNAGETAIKTLVKRTKASAPVDSGNFKKHISSKAITSPTGTKTFVWYVKAPFYRLTHLLVHGHAKSNGGRVPGNPFLQNALDEVLPAYEEEIEEAVKYDR